MLLLMLIAMMNSMDAKPIWQNHETGLYEPIRQDQVAVSRDGRIYLLNAGESRVQVYSTQGELIKTFGKKGGGPGEFAYPSSLFISTDHLYVQDLGKNALHCFDLDGQFQKQVNIQGSPASMVRVKNGWVYGSWRLFAGANDLGEVIWVDDDFQNPKTILTLRKPGTKKGAGSMTIVSGEPVSFNPALDRPHLVSDPYGTKVWLAHTGRQFKLSVIDTEQKKVVKTITRKWPQLPFNETWGEADIEKRNDVKDNASFRVTFKGDFPDYFPHLRNMTYRDEVIYLNRWTAQPDKKESVAMISGAGEDIDGVFSVDALSRSRAFPDGKVLVFYFDEDEEEAGFALCTKDDAEAFAKENPIPEIESKGLVIIGG